jgi:hypothetical protein
MRRVFLYVCATFATMLASTEAFAAVHWGSVSNNGCTQLNKRTFAAQLLDIPWGQDWNTACFNTAAVINGQFFAHPTRCNNMFFGEWGEWDVTDTACPHWSAIAQNECTNINVRKFSAQLLDIPSGVSWATACAAEPATINGQTFLHPARCNNMIVGEWGEWDVTDTACPHWSTIATNECNGIGTRKFSAQILDAPSGVSWATACFSEPAVINGQVFASPARCNNMGIGEWGEWDVPAAECPHWSSLEAKECTGLGVRRFAAQILDVPSGVSWEAACFSEPVTINGAFFPSPAECNNMGIGEWGEWDAPDDTCPHWHLQEIACSSSDDATRIWRGHLEEIPDDVSWHDACMFTPADIEGQHFDGATFCWDPFEFGDFLVDDPECPVCGDGTCEYAGGYQETCTTCPEDCGACPPPPVCGDGDCDGGETPSTCSTDCGTCGNNDCDAGETCGTCEHDCGPCPTTCSGAIAGPGATVYRIGIEDLGSHCGLALMFYLANSQAEAETCGQNELSGVQTIVPNAIPDQYTYSTSFLEEPCVQTTFFAFSPEDAAICGPWRGYPYHSTCLWSPE